MEVVRKMQEMKKRLDQLTRIVISKEKRTELHPFREWKILWNRK